MCLYLWKKGYKLAHALFDHVGCIFHISPIFFFIVPYFTCGVVQISFLRRKAWSTNFVCLEVSSDVTPHLVAHGILMCQ